MTKPTRIFTVLAALLAFGTSLPAAQPSVQVATIDLDRALNEYWKTQKKSGELMERNKSAQEQVDEVQKRMAGIADEV
jgi:Skp family chaperone for outer membrane proteins